MDMKNLIQQMTDIQNSNKEQLNEAATISISAETGAEIADMIAAMQGHAGVGAKPVPADMPMPMRTDIDKFRAAMDDDPSIPGKDDVEGDQDLNAGLMGALAGGALGSAAGAATGATGALAAKGAALGAKAGSGIAGAMGKGMLGKAAGGAMGAKVGSAVGSALPGAAGAAIGDKMTDPKEEGYDNEPEPEYQDHKHMTKDLSGGINREKKMYAKAQDGDNALAVETIKAALMKALSEKKAKPDFLDMDGDGDKKEPMKKAIKDKKKKTNEAEFKKTGRDGDGSAKFDEMGCKEEMKKLNASGCAKMEMYKKVHEKYGCSKQKFEKLYASHCN
jgi:hypothetical protein